MKKFIAIAIALLTSQLCFADDLPNFPFVYASEEASTNIPPDSVVINFTVMSHNESSSNACAAVQGKCAEIFKTILSKHEINKADITAKNLRKTCVRKRGEQYEQLEVLGYDASRNIIIKTRNIKGFAKLMQYLVSSDLVINIDADFECSFSDKIITELTEQACEKAYNKAQMLAKCSGEEIDRLFAISTSGLDNLAMRFKISDFLSKGDISLFGSSVGISEDVFFVPDTVEYTGSVSAIYKLK